MYLLSSLVFVFGLTEGYISPNPTCGPKSKSKKPCTTGSKDSYYLYTVRGEVTCDGSADIDDRGITPVPNGRAQVQLILKNGGTVNEATRWRGMGGSTSPFIYNHESWPFQAKSNPPSNRFKLYGKDDEGGNLYPWIRVYGASCNGAGRMEDSARKGKERAWWFYIWNNCHKARKQYSGTHYDCNVTMDLNLRDGNKWEGESKEWKGKPGPDYNSYGKYEIAIGAPSWAADQDAGRPVEPAWTPAPLDLDKAKKRKEKKEKETKKKKEKKTE